MSRPSISGVLAFVRSVALVGVLTVGVPCVLVALSRSRFGGASPLHGLANPADWRIDRIERVLTGSVADRTVADLVIRLSLVVSWCAVALVMLTVIAEVAHMVRHDGMALPDIRGLSAPQSTARVIATGLLVVMPMFTTSPRAVAREGVQLLPLRHAAPAIASVDARWRPFEPERGRGANGSVRGGESEPTPDRSPTSDAGTGQSPRPDRYTVRAGDSIYGIAERMVGPDARAVAEFAQRVVELNLGNQMPDGSRFTNAAFIDVGWELVLPPSGFVADPRPNEFGTHVVERGESLWSIAEDELGDGARWRGIFAANEGRTFDDGRQLLDPDLIRPGWMLDVSIDEIDEIDEIGDSARPQPVADLETPEPDPVLPDNVWRSRSVPATDLTSDASAALADSGGDSASEVTELTDPPGPMVVAGPEPARATATVPADLVGSARISPNDPGFESDSPELLDFGRAAMLSAGVLSLLAVRRRSQLRRARPRARLPERRPGRVATERALRSTDPGVRFARVDTAIRSVARLLVEEGVRVMAVLVDADGDLDLCLSGPAMLPWPWMGAADAWRLAGTTPLELLAHDAVRVGSPCPTMVQLGRDQRGRDVYVDLEAWEAIQVDGPADQADAIVAAIAATLAGSERAEVTTLIGVGIPDGAFLGHRLHVCVPDGPAAVDAAREAVGTTISEQRSTFELRTRADASEVWESAVVLAGSAAGEIVLPFERSGIAVFSASPIVGLSSRLVAVGDAWEFEPLGLQMVPVGLSVDDIAALADLVDVADPEPQEVSMFRLDEDDTLIDPDDHDETCVADARLVGPDDLLSTTSSDVVQDVTSSDTWPLMVRLLGPVEVVAAAGESVSFERSKTRELVAWLATHRGRSTRTAARTALWELDVRDATFANVVSEARRSLARLVKPPEGDEWVGRTMTEALPLHELICTDAEVLERSLEAARSQPPDQAIATLTPAVELITGFPFEGTSYLWPDPEGITSNLVLLATSATSELAAHCLSVGDVAGVFRATGRGLRVLPGHEELIGLRMQAHARSGDHAGVRQEWESYERAITADPWSDGEPSPKLVELRRELLGPPRPDTGRADESSM
jgi:hypothetical protein